MRPKKAITAVCLLGIAILISGCVYLRLLHLKGQIARFDDHFRVDTAQDVVIHFLDPVLLEADMEAIGFKPTSMTGDEGRQVWGYVFKKLVRDGFAEGDQHDILIDIAFHEGKLARVTIPEQYFDPLPKAFLVELFKSVGEAKIDVVKRRIVANPSHANEGSPETPPVFSNITESIVTTVLGQPYAQTQDDGKTVLEYRYRLLPKGAAGNLKNVSTRRPYIAKFTFDSRNTLESIDGVLPSAGNVAFH